MVADDGHSRTLIVFAIPSPATCDRSSSAATNSPLADVRLACSVRFQAAAGADVSTGSSAQIDPMTLARMKTVSAQAMTHAVAG
jgi:hypothetical protein